VSIPFCSAAAAANLHTNPPLDPFANSPQYKYCAAMLDTAARAAEAAE
jgi:hypothetical protein